MTKAENPSSRPIDHLALRGAPDAREVGGRREAIAAAIEAAGEGDIILLAGGLFLVWKATKEILEMLKGAEHGDPDVNAAGKAGVTFIGIIVQIMILDIVFSLDSVITAVGMTDNLPVMITAIVIAVISMMFFSGPLSRFVDRNPTVKMLALAFLILIGVVLMAEGLEMHFSKAYVYTAMAFSVAVELLNLRLRKRLGPAATTA